MVVRAAGKAFLADLQHRIELDFPASVSSVDPALLDAYADLLGKKTRLPFPEAFEPTTRPLPTPTQNPDDFRIIATLLDRFEAQARVSRFDAPDRTTFGTVGLGWFAAETLPVAGSDESVIVFQEGTFTIVWLLAQCVVESLDFVEKTVDGRAMSSFDTSEASITARAKTNPGPAERLAAGLEAYAVRGDALYAGYAGDPAYELSLRGMLLSADLFILCHEFAHVTCGHVKDAVREDIGLVSVLAVEKNHENEFQADIAGLNMSLETVRKTAGFDISLAYWGVALALGGLDLVTRAIAIAKTGADPGPGDASSTHPSYAVRRGKLDAALRDALGEEHAAAPLELANLVQFILELLRPTANARMRALYDTKTRLAPIWRFG